jgi:hypothetical protein
MAKDLTFRVELQFESNIEQDEDVMQVAENIARAIVAETNGQGIAPQNGDTYLEIVRVTPQYINKTVIEHVT